MKAELARKFFHLSSLLYLLGYRWLGRETVLPLLGAWIAAEGCLEAYRLRSPAFNRRLIRLFGGIHRGHEETRVSGVFWTALGCWCVIAAFGARPETATAAILNLVFGDMAAALAGKTVGRVRLPVPGRTKTLEGSLACLTVCVACGLAAGLPHAAAWAGALAATALELAAPPPDDNLWMPLASAAAAAVFMGAAPGVL